MTDPLVTGGGFVDMGNGALAPIVATMSSTANPVSVLTRTGGGDVTAYSINDLVASALSAGSVVVPSATLTRVAAGGATIPKIILLSNHTTGLANVSVTVRLWSAAPTYTNGDNGAYAVATGTAGFLGKFTGTFEQNGDGAAAELVPYAGSTCTLKLASGSTVYWDLQTNTAFTPQSGKTFTAVMQVYQD